MSDETDVERIKRFEGFYVGLLNEHEYQCFRRLCADGIARHSYEGVSGFFGLAKIRFNNA